MEKWTSRHVWFKTYLELPINYWTSNSSSTFAELKHALMLKCSTISVSNLFHDFLMSARSGSTCYHNISSNAISSDRTSWHIDGLIHSIHSVFTENLNLSQVENWATQIHWIHYYIAEIYPVSIHRWGVYPALLLPWGIRYLITLLSYTQN